ncbi:hypothetical protein KDW_55720 [Dictyobacter vulcani]|uniref:MalT-like TPR region domain-containing protein n=1 Tax=Dictyobacter vulcani TaxID=2607529 RepID=A0A5J4KXZ9_9CHLR|nr:hypothetical protein [Dictyobacter vulcani]GER91410.1 hypothetical protein KDW_55720 [Dictyobacter vulcani]
MFLTDEAITERYATVLRSLSEIAEAYYFQGSIDEARKIWQCAQTLLIDQEVQSEQRVKFLLRYGQFLIQYYFLTNHDEDLMHSVVQQAQQGAQNLQDEEALAMAYYLTGQTLYYHNLLGAESDYSRARDYFEQASALGKKIGDFYHLSEFLFYAGLTYDREKPLEEAKNYYQQALALAEQYGNKWATSEAMRHLTDHTEGEQRLYYALHSLKIREEMCFKRGLPPALLLVSDIYIEQGDLIRGLEYCQRAEQLAGEMGLQTYLLHALITHGDIASRQGQIVEAREHFARAAELAQELKMAYLLTIVNEKLAQLANEQ